MKSYHNNSSLVHLEDIGGERMQRIGVFVCWCGSNIAATVDVKAVAEALSKEPGVVYYEDYQYMCSEAGQALIAKAIAEKNLTGIVVCSCSPRMHEATFRKAAEKAGLESYSIKEFPKQEDMFESLLKTDKQEYYTKTILKDKLGDKAQYLEALERIDQIEGVQALMPLCFYN